MFSLPKKISFNYWHNKIQEAAFTPQAFWLCIVVAFCESSFFPIPPDVMIIPMVLSNRKIAFRLALCCTVSSVIGGLLGYYIGYAFFETIGQWIVATYHMESALLKFQADFANYGFWIIALKGLTPIPFKLVTIASGIAKFDLFQFTVASLIARSFRFYMLCSLLWWAGPMLKPFIESKMKWVMGLTMVGIVLGFIIVKFIYS
ncbi:MAG: YqaA family protein [Alphaproteobacteria bacterium]|nr:YqaA family protein [Alphaproteobacteria bacterium]